MHTFRGDTTYNIKQEHLVTENNTVGSCEDKVWLDQRPSTGSNPNTVFEDVCSLHCDVEGPVGRVVPVHDGSSLLQQGSHTVRTPSKNTPKGQIVQQMHNR